jgi:hypothetical protein
VPGQSSPFGNAYRFRRPPEAYEIVLEPGMAPENRVRLQSNERNFLSLPRKEHGMGDKGGKKDKAKSQKQKIKKQKDKSRKQQEKQKPRTP